MTKYGNNLHWYLITAEHPSGLTVSKFRIGHTTKSVAKKFRKKLRGTEWKYKGVTYLDDNVSELMASHWRKMWDN